MTDELLQLESLPGPLLVDNMENEASKSYGSFPDRLYIVLKGKIVYQVTQLVQNFSRQKLHREELGLMDTTPQILNLG